MCETIIDSPCSHKATRWEKSWCARDASTIISSTARLVLCYAISRICRNLQPSSYCLLPSLSFSLSLSLFFFRDRRDLLRMPAFLTSGKGESNRIRKRLLENIWFAAFCISLPCEILFGDFKCKMAALYASSLSPSLSCWGTYRCSARATSESLISERCSVTSLWHTYS